MSVVSNSTGRKPAHIELAGGKSNRQIIWEAIRAQRDSFTGHGVAKGIDIFTVRTYVRSLEKGGYIQVIPTPEINGKVCKKTTYYKLVKDVGLEAPRLNRQGGLVTQGLPQENMWRTMRIVGGDFNCYELAGLASTDSIKVSDVAARSYLRHLEKAGYVTMVAKGKGRGSGGIPARYRFNPTKYSGPRPPMIQRTKAVYDPNLNEIVWQEVAGNDE